MSDDDDVIICVGDIKPFTRRRDNKHYCVALQYMKSYISSLTYMYECACESWG